MNTKLILFSHYYVNDEIINRFNNLKKLNPTWDIISIGFEGYKLLDNSITTNKEIYPSNKDLHYFALYQHLDWFDGDLFLYDVYQKFPNYNEYFLYEYDTICNVSIDSFFDTSLDFFGSTICNPGREDWDWIKLYRKHNIYNTRFEKLYSCGQTTAIYFKNNILKQCVNELFENKYLYNNMFSEVRCGTLVSQFTSLKMGNPNNNKFISWIQNDINVDENIHHFYHPVK